MKKAVSAGGILIRTKNGMHKILLLTFPGSDLLRFPKGHIEKGETLEQTAIREVSEETGLMNLKIVRNLGYLTRKSTENSGEEVIKDVHIFLMKTEDYDHQSSYEEHAWIPLEFALSHMYFPEEAEFLNKYKNEILKNG